MDSGNNNRWRILHIAPTPFFSDRGCHIRIEGMVRSLNKLGHTNTVCTYHHGNEYEGVTTKRIGNIKGYTKTSAGPSAWKPWADLKLLLLSIQQIRTENPHVLHASLHEGVLIALLSKWLLLRNIPVIADLQGSLVGELESYGFFNRLPFLKWPFKWLEGFLLFCSNQIICSSEHSVEKFTAEFPRSAHKISLVQDGADKAKPLPERERQRFKQQLSISDDRLIAVYSGALLESKGLNHLHELMLQCIKGKAARIHFLIIGYPTESTAAFIQEHSIESNCTLTGRVDFKDLNNYLGIADIAIDTKRSDAGEGSGKTLNYLANSLPVVAFNTLNNRHFLGADAKLADNDDELVEILKSYADDKESRTRQRQINEELFDENCSWLLSQKQLESVYKLI